MANVVKPKLNNVGGNIEITNYSYKNSNTTTPETAVAKPTFNTKIDVSLNTDYTSEQQTVDPELKDILSPQEGIVSSIISKFHIFDDVEGATGGDGSNPTAVAAPVSGGVSNTGSNNTPGDPTPKTEEKSDKEPADKKDEPKNDTPTNTTDQKPKEEPKKEEQQKEAQEPTPASEPEPKEEPKPDDNTNTDEQPSKKQNGIPKRDANGYIIREKSEAGQRVINKLFANGVVNSPHPAELDAAIDALSAEECAWVLSRIENEGFGQTVDGYYTKSVRGDQNFIDNQLYRRYNGDIHNLLKAWGTYSYSGY